MSNRLITDPGKIAGIFSVFKAIERKSGKVDWDQVDEFANNVVNAGGALMADLLIGAGGTTFNNSNARIGVGDSATAVAIGQTDLQAASNKLRKAMDATFPSRSGQVVTWQATFSTAEANWQWNEMAVFNSSSGATMFARGVSGSPITKTAGATLKAIYQCTFPTSY